MDNLKMYWSEKISPLVTIQLQDTRRLIVVNIHFDRVWLETATITGHTAFRLDSIAGVYTDEWVSHS